MDFDNDDYVCRKFGLWLGYRAILLVLHVIMIFFNLHNNISIFEIVLAVLVLLDAVQKGIEVSCSILYNTILIQYQYSSVLYTL